jgi:hypothetical protein
MALDDNGQRTEGATYYAADFALVEPECFDQVKEFLAGLDEQFFQKYPNATQTDFQDVDERAMLALQGVVENWIVEYVHVQPQWLKVGESVRLTVPGTEASTDSINNPKTPATVAKRIRLKRLQLRAALFSESAVATIKARRISRAA